MTIKYTLSPVERYMQLYREDPDKHINTLNRIWTEAIEGERMAIERAITMTVLDQKRAQEDYNHGD